MTNSILTFVLGVLVLLCVIFALRTINGTRTLRSLTLQAASANNSLMQAQTLVNDIAIYNQKNPSPELTKLLQSVQAKPATH